MFQVVLDNILDATNIVLRLPHVVETSAALPLLCSLDNLHALHIRAKHLDPHLDGDAGQFVAQQERGINPPLADVQTDAREWIAALECHTQDVANLGAPRVPSIVEQLSPFTRRVENIQLFLSHSSNGIWTGV